MESSHLRTLKMRWEKDSLKLWVNQWTFGFESINEPQKVWDFKKGMSFKTSVGLGPLSILDPYGPFVCQMVRVHAVAQPD